MRAAFHHLTRFCNAVTLTSLFALVVVTGVDVAGRVLFNAPLGFAYELIGVLLGIAVFAGLVDANWQRDHIRIDLADTLLGKVPGLERLADGLVWLLELAFSLLLAVMVARQAMMLKSYGEEFLFLPMAKWMPIVLIAVFLVLSLSGFAVHLLTRNKAPESPARSQD